ncbi:MAG TPA: GNAT family N-acetyltransferase [Pyrinomonadaceae bacterium]|jgi:RimJ/RimL family protein N-acetyltransferase|nr:GNAT family N-acetyltransferase [Pyrinomonadaceae bacterium]
MINSETLPTITAGRIALRWLTGEDVPALFAIFSEADVMRYWSSPPLEKIGEASELLAHIQDGFRRRALFQWGVARRADDRVIGTCTLFHPDPDNRRAELGYALGREHWGNGYMREALTSLLDYAFGELNLHRLEADVDPRNASSIRTLERLGFRQEGYLRERWLVGGGIQDSLFYGLLRSEWQAR